MDERPDHQPDPDATGQAVPALMEAQLEAARAEVFRAYVRSRAKARDLAFDDVEDEADRQRHAS
jgi:hypothetical protein